MLFPSLPPGLANADLRAKPARGVHELRRRAGVKPEPIRMSRSFSITTTNSSPGPGPGRQDLAGHFDALLPSSRRSRASSRGSSLLPPHRQLEHHRRFTPLTISTRLPRETEGTRSTECRRTCRENHDALPFIHLADRPSDPSGRKRGSAFQSITRARTRWSPGSMVLAARRTPLRDPRGSR